MRLGFYWTPPIRLAFPVVCVTGRLSFFSISVGVQIELVNPGVPPGQVMADQPGFRPTRSSVVGSGCVAGSAQESFSEEEEETWGLGLVLSLSSSFEWRKAC